MRLNQQAQVKEKLTRTFWFTPSGDPANQFTVTASYLSSAVFDEHSQKVKPKVVAGRTKEQAFDLKAFTDSVVKHVLLKAVDKIEGVTFHHIRSLVMLDPAFVKANGGMDAKIPLDPEEVLVDDQKKVDAGEITMAVAKERAREVATENIEWLLKGSTELFNWCVNLVSSLENFQDEDWEEQLKN